MDKEFTLVIYKACTNIKITCTYNISQMKKILNFQKGHLLSKCLKTVWKLKYRKIEIIVTISSGLKLGQGVLYCILQSLYYKLDDMHKLTPNIHEVMKFPK
jgi:hypothetical protein